MSSVNEIGEELTKEEIRIHIDRLRQLITDNPFIEHLRTDDAYLLRFLHCCDFNVGEAHKRIQSFYELLLEYPDWFACNSPLQHRKFITQDIRALLSDNDNEGKRIYICKLGNINADKINVKQLAQVDQLWMESILDDEEVQLRGICAIIDLEGFSWKVYKWLTPQNIRAGSKIINVYPIKNLTLHIVNTSIFVNTAIKLIWPFLGQNIKNTVKFHYSNIASLHEYVSPDVLPKEYGGIQNLNYEDCYDNLFSMSDTIGQKLNYIKVCTSKT